jgi:FKBP-type peptidyl-prolyl cis-trans isomerase (trigger factor)
MKIERKNKEKGIVAVKVTLPFEKVEEKKDQAFKKLSENIEVEGFRKGNVPEKILKEKISNEAVLQEAAQEVINEVFPKVLAKEELQIIGFPAINVTKLAEGNDFEFTIEMATYPKIDLPDYRAIAKEINVKEKEITDEDIKAVEKNVLDMLNHQAHHEKNGPEHKEGEEIEETYKELTDELVQKVSPFKTIEEFKKQVKEDLEKEAKVQAQMGKREQIAEKILSEIDVEIPEMLVNAELDKILAQLKDDVMRHGID